MLPAKTKPKLDRAVTGRKKGTPNKVTALLKDAILTAAERAGGREGLVGYLQTQAIENPGPFMNLLGKVLPTQLAADPDDIGPPVIILRKFSADGPEVPLIQGDYTRRD